MKIEINIYKRAGLVILPVKKNKAPDINNWKNEISEDEFKKDIYGIGIVCGKRSNNVECLDFDNHFKDAKERLTKYLQHPDVKVIYETYKLPIQSTQSGGFHIIYRTEKPGSNQKLACKPIFDKKTNKFRPDAIIETRGEGGYFVAYPTPNYKVIRNDILDIQEITIEERKILIDVAKSFDEMPKVIESDEKVGNIYNEDYKSVDEAKNILINHGWKQKNDKYWMRPGKKDGISAAFGFVAHNVFNVFTSNGHPFEETKGYKPFQIMALLDYNGDFKECAKELAKRYNIKPQKKEEKKKIPKDILRKKLEKAFIDVNNPPKEPQPILSFRQGKWSESDIIYDDIPVFTFQNISVIHGKAKSKKTFLNTLFTSGLIEDNILMNKFVVDLPIDKKQVLYFDTEQGRFDVYRVNKRVLYLIQNKKKIDNLGMFGLAGEDANMIVQLIEYSLDEMFKNVAVVFIDQVADLLNSVNDEKEAVRLVKKIENWKIKYNIHVCCVLHQNKHDGYAQGWLGTQLMKKAQTIIKVNKDNICNNISHVEPDLMRGREFEMFSFQINDSGIPEMLSKEDTKELFDKDI
jgi:hypothetical protein